MTHLFMLIPYSFTVTSHFPITLGLSFSILIGITITIVLILLILMESSGNNRQTLPSSSVSISGFGNEDDQNDPFRRKWKAVSDTCQKESLSFLRELLIQISEETQDENLRGLNNTNTRRFNSAITQALEERFGHSRYTWRRIAHFLTIGVELTTQGDQSSFFLSVLHLVKE